MRDIGIASGREPDVRRDESARSVNLTFRGISAIQALKGRRGGQAFTVRDVYGEMAAAGTRYEESTVFKTMQRMKAPPQRAPMIQLERAGREGFRIADASIGR